MSIVFRTGISELAERAKSKRSFEYGALPEGEKERLCRALLAEFGVTSLRATDDGELIHCCALPWHDERHPSASLNYKKLVYKCYGCDSSGGLLWLIGICRDGDADDARKWLNDQTGLGADEQPLHRLLEFFDFVYEKSTSTASPIPKMSAKVLEPWRIIHPYLTDPRSEEGRGIPEENIVALQVGYGKLRLRMGDGFVESERIIIPHFWRGDLTGWQSRRLIKDGTGKYESTPDFPRETTLYNFQERAREVVVVESPMSVISKYHLDVGIEATFGASVSDKQVKHLAKHPRVILFLDNDEAGWTGTERLIEALEPYSMVRVANSRWAADPADMDDETYMACVESAVPASLWRRPPTLDKLEVA